MILKVTIDRVPPTQSGDEKKDISEILNYLNYLQEEVNRLISLINKGEQNGV